MATADDLLAAAAHNNAAWCAAVCRSHGIATREVAGWSFADAPAPTYYPDAVSLSEHADAGALPQRTPLAVKDSFATLRLQPYGFRVLLDGAWLRFRPESPIDGWQEVTAAGLDVWTAAHGDAPAIQAALLDDPDVRLLMTVDRTSGVIASRAAGVVGVSN